MNATIVYVQHADGSSEVGIAGGTSRPPIQETLVSLGLSHQAVAYRRADGDAGPWLVSTPEGELPIDPSEVPWQVVQHAEAVGRWRPTHALFIYGKRRYVMAPAEGDGPAPSLGDWLAATQIVDGAVSRPVDVATETGLRGGVWYYQGAPFGGEVTSLVVPRPAPVPPYEPPAVVADVAATAEKPAGKKKLAARPARLARALEVSGVRRFERRAERRGVVLQSQERLDDRLPLRRLAQKEPPLFAVVRDGRRHVVPLEVVDLHRGHARAPPCRVKGLVRSKGAGGPSLGVDAEKGHRAPGAAHPLPRHVDHHLAPPGVG